MLQPIKMEHYFDSEGRNIKDCVKMAVSWASKTYLTDKFDKNTLIFTFYGCLEAK